jgi:hypothetical protein
MGDGTLGAADRVSENNHEKSKTENHEKNLAKHSGDFVRRWNDPAHE